MSKRKGGKHEPAPVTTSAPLPTSTDFWEGFKTGVEEYDRLISDHGRIRALTIMRERAAAALGSVASITTERPVDAGTQEPVTDELENGTWNVEPGDPE